MLGWLKKKGDITKVGLCTREVRNFLECRDESVKGRVIAKVALMRANFITSGLDPNFIVEPQLCEQSKLRQSYNALELIKYQRDADLKNVKQQMQGSDTYNILAEMKEEQCALSVIMINIGYGFAEKYNSMIEEVFDYLYKGQIDYDYIIDHHIEFEKRLNNIPGGPQSTAYSQLDRDSWKNQMKMIPNFLIHLQTRNACISD